MGKNVGCSCGFFSGLKSTELDVSNWTPSKKLKLLPFPETEIIIRIKKSRYLRA